MDWRSIHDELKGDLSSEEEHILELLSVGLTQPDIGKQLGLHRSAVWRRIKKIRLKVDKKKVS